jgi:hypothetical protein
MLLLLRVLTHVPELTESSALSGSIISVDLCVSPRRPDHILPCATHKTLAFGL